MSIRISVLGSVRIEDNSYGLPIKIPKKATALLAYLALQPGRRASREVLANLLWPYQETNHGRHSLRNCLLEIRKHVGFEAIETDFAYIGLSPMVTCDVDEFLATASGTDDLSRRCDLYRDVFLDGLDLPSEPWEEWLREQREKLRAEAMERLTRLTDLASTDGRYDLAVATGRRALQIDGSSERACQSLMRAHLAAGYNGNAAAVHRTFRAFLNRELGVQPSKETDTILKEAGAMAPKTKAMTQADEDVVRQLCNALAELDTAVKHCEEWREKYLRLRNAIRVVKSARDEPPPELAA